MTDVQLSECTGGTLNEVLDSKIAHPKTWRAVTSRRGTVGTAATDTNLLQSETFRCCRCFRVAKDFKLASVNLGHSATWSQRRPCELVLRACQLTSVSWLLPEVRVNQRESFYHWNVYVETCAGQENLTLESESVEVGVLSDGLQRGIRKMRDTQQRNGRQGGTSINQSLWGQSMRVTCKKVFSLKTQLQPHQDASVW